MFDSFLLLTPALSDDVVTRYFKYYLEKCTSDLKRNIDFARYRGRFSDFDEQRLSLLPVIYESFLKRGIRRKFPMDQIDPNWDSQTVELVLRLYDIEANKVLSRQKRDEIHSNYASLTGETLNSEEHIAQLRGAQIRASLQAVTEFLDHDSYVAQSANTDSTPVAQPVPAPEAQTALAEDKNALPPVTGPAASPSVIVIPDPVQPATQATKTSSKTSKAICKTMKSLEVHFEAAKEDALSATPDTWSDDIAHIFHRTVVENDMSKDVAKAREADIRRFMFITSITNITEIKQAHLTHWADSLQKFPKSFMRSDKDAHRTIEEVYLNARHVAPDERGLSSSTTRRHVKSMELLIARARAEGVPLPALETKGLKPKKKSSLNKHKSRAVFRVEEARQLFTHTLWTGARSEGRRHDAGTTIVKDGKYWIPLILAYTGARRAEIAGMLASDVQIIDDIPTFVIQANVYRGIKGEAADCHEDDRLTRLVPIHSHLIELGIMEYAASITKKGHSLLFPDVVPVPRKGSKRATTEDLALSVEKFGERFDDTWRKSMTIALKGNRRKLCIHSLRHYVNHTLLHCRDVHDVTRTDLVGHIDSNGNESINTSTYRDETPLHVKRDAIEKLPRLM